MEESTTSHQDGDEHAKTLLSSLAVVPLAVPEQQRDDDGKAMLTDTAGDGRISECLETTSCDKDNVIASKTDDHIDQQRDADEKAEQLSVGEPQAEGSHPKEEKSNHTHVKLNNFLSQR